MTPTEFEYCQRAMLELAKPLSLMQRIKVQRTMAQILNRSAERMEETFVDQVERKLYESA
jgi:uncharacterized membrane protein YfbV (UPF0208 family)